MRTLVRIFEAFGQVQSASTIKDKYSGQSYGFGFVGMTGKSQWQAAIQGINGREFIVQILKVREARPKRTDRNPSFARIPAAVQDFAVRDAIKTFFSR